MELEMVLNELSLRVPAEDRYIARERMSDFIKMVVTATSHGVKRTIRTHSNLDSLELASGYPVARWRNDIDVDRDARRFFTTLVTKSPFLDDVLDPDIHNSFDLSDFFHNGDRAFGLGVAFLLEAFAVSIQSEACWYVPRLQLTISQMGDDGEVTDIIEEIPHASISDHVYEHLNWIKKRLEYDKQSVIHKGIDIWNHKDQWFPHLYFCEKVEEQLQTLPQGDMIKSVFRWLQKLESYCNGWSGSSFEPGKISNGITTESFATLQTFGKERTFLCPDGIPRTFSWHAKMRLMEWRIYLEPLPAEKKLIIGYIGPHLPTVDYH